MQPNGPKPRRRTIGGVVPSVSAILRAFDDWDLLAKRPDSGLTIDYEPVWIYYEPNRTQGREVTRAEFEGSGEGGMSVTENAWPRPGKYEIHVVDSNGDPVIEPFCGEHWANDSSIRRAEDMNPTAIMTDMMDQLRITARDAEARARKAEQREEDIRSKLRSKDDQHGKTLGELSRMTLLKAQAEADRDLALGQLADMEQKFKELEDSVTEFRPHIAMAVDHLADRAVQYFGLPAAVANAESPATGPDATGEPSGNYWTPPPPGGEDKTRFRLALEDIVRNPRKLRFSVESDLLTWDEARGLLYHLRGVDPGEQPMWKDEALWAEIIDAWDQANGAPPDVAAAAE